jgi:2-oxoglutarate ferredoxin oxidoreductase subunit beta
MSKHIIKQSESWLHERYLRHSKKFPNVWCSGCGIGIVLQAIMRAIDELGLDKNEVAMISGIGCSGRMPVYVDFNTMHTTHGRALAFATGLKMVRPWMKILVIMGDGDALAIGGNHFIHAARRNIGLTAIVINNSIYGMTGGQYSPTTPLDAISTTSPHGHIEQSFPITELGQAAGASFVARSTVYHVRELTKLFVKAISKNGFSLVEAVSYCHTTFGRRNNMRLPTEMMHYLKENTITVQQAEKLAFEERKSKIVRGVLYEHDAPEYTQLYNQVIKRAQAVLAKEAEQEQDVEPVQTETVREELSQPVTADFGGEEC